MVLGDETRYVGATSAGGDFDLPQAREWNAVQPAVNIDLSNIAFVMDSSYEKNYFEYIYFYLLI